MPGCSVKRLPGNMVIELGRRIHFDERDALDLAKRLHLPVPRVHEAQKSPDGEGSIRMVLSQGGRSRK